MTIRISIGGSLHVVLDLKLGRCERRLETFVRNNYSGRVDNIE